MMSKPRCRKRSGSRMCSMFASEPVSKLSTQMTRLPRASSSSQRWDPRKPAPPVTRQVAIPASDHTRAFLAAIRRDGAVALPYHRSHGDRQSRPRGSGPPHGSPDRRPRRSPPVHRLRDRDQRAVRAAGPARASSNWASRATSPTRAGCTARCTASRCGRCASTPATRPRGSRTNATATCSRRARPGCRWPSTCRPSWGSTRTTRGAWARSGAPGWRSTRSTTCARPSRRYRSIRCPPR